MDKKEKFLDGVCAHVREKSVHNDIRAELGSHIEEIIEAEMRSGLNREEAEAKALQRMGDPEEIGLELDKKHRPKTEWPLIVAAFTVAAAGAAVSLASGMGLGKTVYVAVGFALMLGIMFLNFSRLKTYAMPVYIGYSALLLLLSVCNVRLAFPLNINARLAIVQLAQLAPVMFAPLIFRGERVTPVRTAGLCVLMALPFLAVFSTNTAAYILLLWASYTLVFIVLAAMKNKTARTLLPVSVVLTVAVFSGLLVMSPYMTRRLEVFFSAGLSDPQGSGWLTLQVASIIKNARLIGGIPGGIPDIFSFYSEYALAGVLGRYGWIPTICIIAAVGALLWRLFAAAAKINEPCGFTLALSASAVLELKFIVNILMNFNLFPCIGLGLPIVGGGGADCLVTFILLGVVLSVCRSRDMVVRSLPRSGAAFWHRLIDKVYGE